MREQVSWVVEDREAATIKAERLISAAVGRVRHLQPLQKRQISIRPVGAGDRRRHGRLLAARDIGQRGMAVTLLEKSALPRRAHCPGWRAVPDRPTVPRAAGPSRTSSSIIRGSRSTPMPSSSQASGFIGDFRTTVRLHPRGVGRRAGQDAGGHRLLSREMRITNSISTVTKRKAIYLPYAGSYPAYPAIDWATCTKCGRCVRRRAARASTWKRSRGKITVQSGVVVMATGFNPYAARRGEYGWGLFPT